MGGEIYILSCRLTTPKIDSFSPATSLKLQSYSVDINADCDDGDEPVHISWKR
jgi:hypothetical protein